MTRKTDLLCHSDRGMRPVFHGLAYRSMPSRVWDCVEVFNISKKSAYGEISLKCQVFIP